MSKNGGCLANSIEPDETSRFVASDPDLRSYTVCSGLSLPVLRVTCITI